MNMTRKLSPLLILAVLPTSWAIDCNGNHNITKPADVEALRRCSKFTGDIILSDTLSENIDLADIDWSGNNSITNTRCSGMHCPHTNLTMSSDVKSLWKLDIDHGPFSEISLPQLESIQSVRVNHMNDLTSLQLANLKQAKKFAIRSCLALVNVTVAEDFRAGTTDLNPLQEEGESGGLYLREVPRMDYNLFASSDQPYGKVSLSPGLNQAPGGAGPDRYPTVIKLTLRNMSSVTVDGTPSADWASGNVTFQASNSKEQTASSMTELFVIDKVDVAPGHMEAVRKHHPGIYLVNQLIGDTLMVPFSNLSGLAIADSANLTKMDVRLQDWANWELETLFLRNNAKLETRPPRILPDDLDGTDPEGNFYWPAKDLRNMILRGNLTEEFFDAFIYPERYSNNSKWERKNRPKVNFMSVNSNLDFNCTGLSTLVMQNPAVVKHLFCQDETYHASSLGVRLQIGWVQLMVVVAAVLAII